jgi:hypothetical protein
VLDPPAVDPPLAGANDLIDRLQQAWPSAGPRSWIWASRETIASHEDCCVTIYLRA